MARSEVPSFGVGVAGFVSPTAALNGSDTFKTNMFDGMLNQRLSAK